MLRVCVGVVRENGVIWRVSTAGASESRRIDLCILFCVFRRPTQADRCSCAVVSIPTLAKAEVVSLPTCEHPGRIPADFVHSFEADLGRDVQTGGAIAATEAASCSQLRGTEFIY